MLPLVVGRGKLFCTFSDITEVINLGKSTHPVCVPVPVTPIGNIVREFCLVLAVDICGTSEVGTLLLMFAEVETSMLDAVKVENIV